MRLVVADTGPLNYLVLTGDIELLPKLFGRVLAPQAVCDELADRDAPAEVRAWIAQTPTWLEVRQDPDIRPDDAPAQKLDRGERAAVALALAVKADLVLMDDRDGATVARREGLVVIGTLGVLDLASRRAMIDLAETFTRLTATSFYYRQGLLDALLAQHAKRDP